MEWNRTNTIVAAGVVALAIVIVLALRGCGDDESSPSTSSSVAGPATTSTTPDETAPKPKTKKGPTVKIDEELLDKAGYEVRCKETIHPARNRHVDPQKLEEQIKACTEPFNTSAKAVAFCVESVSSLTDDAKVDPGWNFGFCLGQFYKRASKLAACTQSANAYSNAATKARLIRRCTVGFDVMVASLDASDKQIGG